MFSCPLGLHVKDTGILIFVVESHLISVPCGVEDHTVLQVDVSDTDDVICGDVLVLDLEEEAGISQSIPWNGERKPLVPSGKLTLSTLYDPCLVLTGASSSDELEDHEQLHAANDFGVALHYGVENIHVEGTRHVLLRRLR